MWRLVIVGHLPVWAASLLWLVLAAAIVLLVRGIRNQDRRERKQRHQRLVEHTEWLCEHEERLRAIEDRLSITPRPEDDAWPNSASGQ